MLKKEPDSQKKNLMEFSLVFTVPNCFTEKEAIETFEYMRSVFLEKVKDSVPVGGTFSIREDKDSLESSEDENIQNMVDLSNVFRGIGSLLRLSKGVEKDVKNLRVKKESKKKKGKK